MKYIAKLTLTIALMICVGSYQLSAQAEKEVKSTNVKVKSFSVEAQQLTKNNKINKIVSQKTELKKTRVKAVKIYGLVDRNGNPLPTKESVNQIPQ